MKITDKEMLDFLQELNNNAKYTGKCILRFSKNGRGWRLHETSHENAKNSVRAAIQDFMKKRSKDV